MAFVLDDVIKEIEDISQLGNLRRRQKNRHHCHLKKAVARYLYKAGSRSSPSKEEL